MLALGLKDPFPRPGLAQRFRPAGLTMHLIRKEFDLDEEAALQFAAKRGFGLLVAWDGMKPCGSHLPFVIRREANRTVDRKSVV